MAAPFHRSPSALRRIVHSRTTPASVPIKDSFELLAWPIQTPSSQSESSFPLVSFFPLNEGSALQCMGKLEADGSTTLCTSGMSIPYSDATIRGPCILELDHGLLPNDWEVTLTSFHNERAAAQCSADDPWDHGISEPNKLLQALFGIPYDANLGGGISGARCRMCHIGLPQSTGKASYRIGLTPLASEAS